MQVIPSASLHRRLGASLLPLSVLLGCASQPPTDPDAWKQKLADRKLQVGQPLSGVPFQWLGNTEILDSNHVISDDHGPQRFLISLQDCNLRSSSILIFDQRSPSLTTLDTIRVKDGPSQITVPCRIQALNRLEPMS
jgi:hypothetical protein